MSIDLAPFKQADCRSIAGQLGLEPRGSLIRCPSPAHEDRNPSCQIFADGWRCHSCAAHGDQVDLVRHVCGLDFVGAVRELERMLSVRVDQIDRPRHCRPSKPAGPRPLPKPSALRIEVAKRIADLVIDQPDIHDAACRWLLDERGIHPRSAWAAGSRSWVRAHDALLDLWRSLTPEQRIEAGLAASNGRPWWPLRQPLRFLMIPAWRPGEPFPIAWRARVLDPGDDGPKELAQPGRSLWPVVGLEVARGDGVPAVRPEDAAVVIVCEGAMDGLAVLDVLEAEGRRDVAVIALTAPSSGWRSEWTASVRGCRRVIVAAHNVHGPAIVRAVVAELGADKVRHALPPEGDDLNDLHRDGLLVRALEAWTS